MPEGAPIQMEPHQYPPAEGTWNGLLMRWGRGAGKSHALTYYLRKAVQIEPQLRARLIGPTLGDVIQADVYGPAGILAKDPQCEFRASAPGGAKLVWPSGAECLLIGVPTMRDVDRLRASGNRELDLWEEGAAIPVLQQAFEQAALGRRRGRPRWVMATTPRALPFLRELENTAGVITTRATSHDNPHNPPEWVADLEKMYAGTRLYRQEVLGEILDDVEGALWKQLWLDNSRVTLTTMPQILKKVVGVDPASGMGTTGIVVVGLGADKHLYVLEDLSKPGLSADEWAATATEAAFRHHCPIVAENDMGGDMVRGVLKAARKDAVVKSVRARKLGGKQTRAVPVALLWEKEEPEAHMVGEHPKLEEELTMWEPDTGQASPDRLDALVWACLYLTGQAGWEDTSLHMPQSPFRQASGRGLVRYR